MTRLYILAFINATITIAVTIISLSFPFLHPFMIVHYVLLGVFGSFAFIALLTRLIELERRMVKSTTTTQILHNIQEQVIRDYNRLLRMKGETPINPPLPTDDESDG